MSNRPRPARQSSTASPRATVATAMSNRPRRARATPATSPAIAACRLDHRPTGIARSPHRSPARIPGPRQVIEVLVPGVQHQIVLQHEGRQPHVIRGNRSTLASELQVHGGVVVGRLVVRVQDTDAVLQEETPEEPLVLRGAPPMGETGSKLAKHDERQQDLSARLEDRHDHRDALAEIDVATPTLILQRPLSGSSCAASADSTASSASHAPATSPRSRRFLGATVTPAPAASASTTTSVQTLPGRPRTRAQGLVNDSRDVADGVLHTSSTSIGRAITVRQGARHVRPALPATESPAGERRRPAPREVIEWRATGR